MYAKSARSLSNAQNTRDARGIINNLLTKLDTKKPTQENFTDKFSKLKFINGNTAHKKLIQYIFVKLERSLRNNNEFEPSDLSLEHIMSQSTTGVSPEIIGSIGNLLPLGQGLNGNANVRDFPAKKQVYQQSDYRVVSDFLTTTTQDTWTEDDIIARTEALATHAYNTVWGN
ncbi:HNH endonuclease family protein [Photobacterium damselae subsp. piscicida]|nr:HNH endonuclease family protein [Photobacterium damselae subsp. piscicida]